MVGNGSTVAHDPPAEAALRLTQLLSERGVAVGESASSHTPPTGAVLLGAVPSVPLHELLRHVLTTSDNQLSDGVFRMFGTQIGHPTWAGSTAAALHTLQRLGLDTDDLRIADGSGLSRSSRISSAALVQLDAEMARRHSVWPSLMAVSGESGTLRSRLVGSPAEGRLRGKTGTLRDVRSLAGTVSGPSGGRYHFAVVGSGLDERGTHAVRWLQDEVVLALVDDLAGCADPGRAADRSCTG